MSERETAILSKYLAHEILASEYGNNLIELPSEIERALGDVREGDNVSALKIYDALYELNIKAYKTRYKSTTDEEIEVAQMPDVEIDTSKDNMHDWRPRLYNIIRFYCYQCSEFNTPPPLLASMFSLKTNIAMQIAGSVVKSMNLIWGEF